MPLYVDVVSIVTSFSPPVAEALLKIKAAMSDKSVTPSLAARLIKDHLLVLVSPEDRKLFPTGRSVTWDTIFFSYPRFVFQDEGKKGLLTEIGVAIDTIWSHTKRPARELGDEDTIEVTYFFNMYLNLQQPIEEMRYANHGEFDLFKFCKYCWRHPVPGRSICPIHTIGAKHIELRASQPNNSPYKGSLEYKEGKRQKARFDATLNRILTEEVLEFHDSRFRSQILLPPAGIKAWLALRRPHIRNAIAFEWDRVSDITLIDLLLDTLHNPAGLSFSVQQAYTKANDMIREYNFLIWPMLLRAEAWLIAREELRCKWGGLRKKADGAPTNLQE